MGEPARKLRTAAPPAVAITTALLFITSGGLSARRMTRPTYRARVLLRQLCERRWLAGASCECGSHRAAARQS